MASIESFQFNKSTVSFQPEWFGRYSMNCRVSALFRIHDIKARGLQSLIIWRDHCLRRRKHLRQQKGEDSNTLMMKQSCTCSVQISEICLFTCRQTCFYLFCFIFKSDWIKIMKTLNWCYTFRSSSGHSLSLSFFVQTQVKTFTSRRRLTELVPPWRGHV